jgi:tRNA-Thr(GGU) m(6)t(6)A37 methyltransferase TsaA
MGNVDHLRPSFLGPAQADAGRFRTGELFLPLCYIVDISRWSTHMEIKLQPIGILHSPYREKFIVPRQPRLVDAVRAELHLTPPYNRAEAVRDLEQFSHLWLIFLFHQSMAHGWQATVRPPRLGGNRRIGVFASRSPFRPNPIGLSAVALTAVRQTDHGPILELTGVDLVDGTPVLDIKPYLPYSDAIDQATGGFAELAPAAAMPVDFSASARQQLARLAEGYPQLQQLIVELLAADPRPAYRRARQDDREYGALLYDFNIRWKIVAGTALVLAVDPV